MNDAARARVRLRDGSMVTIRPMRRGDRALLVEHFDHLGEESRYRRFLAQVDSLSAGQLDYLTHPDHRRHEALFAIDDDGRPVGVARYIAAPGDAAGAELAMAVVDTWQRRGVGEALLARLTRVARAQGISRFTALMLADNAAMRHLFGTLGEVEIVARDGASIELGVQLGPRPAPVAT